jgi:hypothetical protein
MTQRKLASYLAAASLTLGIAIFAAPAFAQKGLNDGGLPADPPATVVQSQSKATPIPTAPYYGRNANDGGTGPQPTVAQVKAAQSQSKGARPSAPPHLGRPVNDGGTP